MYTLEELAPKEFISLLASRPIAKRKNADSEKLAKEVRHRKDELMSSKLLRLLVLCTVISAPVNKEAEGRGRKALIETHLYALQQYVVPLEPFGDARGGAIEPFKDGLLLVTPQGRLAQVSRYGNVTYLGGIDVPMNQIALETHEIMKNPRFRIDRFRIGDVVLKEKKDELEVYVSHHYFDETCMEFRISSTTLALERSTFIAPPVYWKTVFQAEPCVQFREENAPFFQGHQIGGRMLLDGEHHILVAVGDHDLTGLRQDEAKISLDPRSHLGKLIRIDLRTGNAEIFAQGLRVPQGLVRDDKGNLWETEHGPEGGDELNLLIPGSNYGWPEATFGRQYGHRMWPHAQVQGRHTGFAQPVYAWVPSVGISAVAVSNSRQFPLWKDDLLIASLKDKSIFRARLSENRVVYVERIQVGLGTIRDMVQMQDGSIALLLDSSKILFLTRSFKFCKDGSPGNHIYAGDCTPPHDDYYRKIMAEVGSTSLIRSRWDIYAYKDKWIYTKESCSQEDIDRPFFLHIDPVDKADLPNHRKQSGFDNLGFDFGNGGLWDGKRCLITRQLPDYGISRIRTGQNMSENTRWWEVEYVFERKSPAKTDRMPTSLNRVSESPQVQSPGAALFQKRCSSCHNLYEQHDVGPHLVGVLGRQAGQVDGYSGSVALTSQNFVWTAPKLLDYLVDPDRFAPGTSMANVSTPEAEARAIVDFLRSMGAQRSATTEHRPHGRKQVK